MIGSAHAESSLQSSKSTVVMPRNKMKRYWNIDMWMELFESFLNLNVPAQSDHIATIDRVEHKLQMFLCDGSFTGRNHEVLYFGLV